MATTTRRGIVAVITCAVLIALSVGVGAVVGDALGIRTEASKQMTVAAPTVPTVSAAVASPVFDVHAPDTVRVTTALDELHAAQGSARTSGTATLDVEVGTGQGTDDTYTLTGTPSALRIEAAHESGAVRGIYDLASQVRAGRSVTEHLGQTVTSKLPFRMVDLGAVGVTPDASQWKSGTDYSHASDAFANAYLPEAPYVDTSALASDYDDWDAFLRQSLADGYNAVAWPGFIEYTDFADAAGGPVYPSGDEHIARAAALREAFGPFWDRAKALGVKVYLRTDMLALTPALQTYFENRFGSADTTNPALWKVYTDALTTLYQQEPGLSGVLIRIGEGGSIYDTPGFDYYSALAVRTVDAVRTMLKGFIAQAEASDHEVIFRTWSVGIGAVGDMHTDPASYQEVLKGIDSPKLIVSTKYTLGDFYSWLPLNTTLEVGDQRRIIEFQSRREFEGFGAFPNDLGPEFQSALQTLLAKNPHIEGVWSWTQDGGPWRAGPMSLYLKSGFWQLYELNNRLAASLARDPDTDVGAVTEDWAREYFSGDPATVTAIATAMASSRDAVKQGLYLQPFAEKRVFAVGLEPPPEMWLFEWDILTGDTASLDTMQAIIGDRAGEAIRLGDGAVTTAKTMRDEIAATDASTWRDPAMRTAFVGAMDYEVNTLGLLASYREMFLDQAQWHQTLSPDAYARWQSARDRFETLAAAHLKKYDGDLDHPSWNLTAAQLGVDRADRDLPMAWLARALLVLGLAWIVVGIVAAIRRRRSNVGRSTVGAVGAAARATWIAATRPWRAGEVTSGLSGTARVLLAVVPAAVTVLARGVQTSFLAPVHLLVTLGAWAVFVAIAVLLLRGRSAWALIAAVGGVSVLRCLLALFALAFTGPGGYWYAFWTEPGLRMLYIALAFAAFVWTFVAAGWSLAPLLGARRATGVVLAALGAGLAVPSFVVALVGLERVLTVWNDQMGLLPWGLARILGITTYLEIPDQTAWWAAIAGLAICIVGVLLVLPRRRRSAADALAAA